MKLEISQPREARRTFELDSPVVTIGRDPTCDLVLDDPKCSRRHAVLREGPDGLSIRDSDSVNGLVVNGARVKRTPLTVGDEIRIGSVVIRIGAARGPEGTVAPTVIVPRPTLDTPLADLDISEPTTSTSRTILLPEARAARTPFITTLTLLWVVAGIGALLFTPAVAPVCDLLALPSYCKAAGVLLLLSGAASALLLGYGLWSAAPWSRNLQTTLAGAGLASCLFTPSALIVLIYSLRSSSLGGARQDTASARRTEALFLGGLLATLVAAAIVALVAFVAYGRPWIEARRQDHALRLVAARLLVMADAQEQFRRVCNTGYGDIDGLLAPATVIADYPAHGASFIPAALAQPEAAGYRYSLSVFDPIATTPDCPIRRRFRRYSYTAQPLTVKGYHFLVGPGRLIHLAFDRPAAPSDPVLR
jgi:hypothetical protein